MKKILAIIIIPYLVLILAVFYFYFGPGILTGYETLKWKEFQTNVPKNFNVKFYQSKGWQVYSLRKLTVVVKVARQSPAVNLANMARQSGKIIYQSTWGPDTIFYIANPRKTYEMVFARNIADTTIYFSVASPSVFSANYVMKKMTADCWYQGQKIPPPQPVIPLRAYITDLVFFIAMAVPLLLTIVILSFSGRKPAEKYFLGDPIRCEEGFVYYSRGQRFRRKNTFCYLVLTMTRLMVFVFRKPVLEIQLRQEKPKIEIQGKKIIIQKTDEKIVLRPSDIEKWKNELSSYLYQQEKSDQ